MKPIIFLFISTLLFNYSIAQDTAVKKPRELGISFNGFNNLNFQHKQFNFIYKKQKSENVYRRVSALFGNVSIIPSNNFTNPSSGLSLGATWGKEKRKMFSKKVNLVSGWQLISNVSFFTQKNYSYLSFTPGIGAILGFHYNVNDKIYLGVETTPALMVNMNYTDSNTYSDFSLNSINAGFNMNNILFSIMVKL